MKIENSVATALNDNPVIHEINTFIWLRELGKKYRKKITLANVPVKEFDEFAAMGFNAIWLMGVWKRSQAGLEIAKKHEIIMKELHEALPDLQEEDIAGSPYCIKDYTVDPSIGGEKGLARTRKELAARGMKLILDFVPNHVAPDHPWTKSHPGFFITGTEQEMSSRAEDFYKSGKHIFAKARDPFYPPWPDVLQLNVFDNGLREKLLETLKSIAAASDGIRCDMAMLVMNDIFGRNWGEKAGQAPAVDFWNFVIPAVKKEYPGFMFIAESYWDTEPALIAQGFDYCYDKRYYDYLKEGAPRILQHLSEMDEYRDKLLRFIENHDEPRAAGLFPFEKHRACALASLTLPGPRLLHDGQLSGRTVKVPVFLSRRQDEQEKAEISKFYLQLVKLLRFDAVRKGNWALCNVSGWTDNQSCRNLLAWEWVCEHETLMIVVNLSDSPSQAHVKSGFHYRPGRTYQLFDVIHGVLYDRDGEDLRSLGLFVGLQPWGSHAFIIEH